MINTVTLCGSTRFAADFAECNRELTKRGLSVITISFAAEKDADGVEKEKGVKELLDLVHLNKIMRSDAIVIVGDGYIGFSTVREILWAHMQNKIIVHQRCTPVDMVATSTRVNYDWLRECIVDGGYDNTEDWRGAALAKLRELDGGS